MPTLNYYFLQHPELFQREFTNGELVTIAITTVVTILLIIYFANRGL